MRGIFIILLLLNLGFFGWQYTAHGDNPISDSLSAAMGNDKGELQLLSELKEEDKLRLYKNPEKVKQIAGGMEGEMKADADTTPTHEESAVEKPKVCYQVGPFPSSQSRASFITKVESLGYQANKQWDATDETVRYWVYIPPLSSKAEARSIVASLQRKGIKDVAIVSSGEYKNAISLGLFSSKEYARERVALLQKHAFSPKINESTVSKKQYWLNFSGSKALTESRSERLLRDFPNSKLSTVECH